MKNDDGFTLLEIIISIAALSFISVFILQMFMTSSSLNNRAKDVDIAAAKAVTELDNFKKHASLSSYLASDDIRNADESNGIITINHYYDKNWDDIAPAGTGTPADAQYHMQIDITVGDDVAAPRKEGVAYGLLYDVNVNIVDVSSAGNARNIASMQSKKYFPNDF